MPAIRPTIRLLPFVLAALVLPGCGGSSTIAPTTPTADEVRETEKALEAAAAAEKPAAQPAQR